MPALVSLYEAKTHLSSLVDRAAAGEEIIIAKHGIPHARLVPITTQSQWRVPANVLEIGHVAPDFDAPDLDIERLFNGGAG